MTPPVIKLPPVMLPVATINPAVPKLPTLALPVLVKVFEAVTVLATKLPDRFMLLGNSIKIVLSEVIGLFTTFNVVL